MKYDRAEAVRYMGAKKDDNEAAVLADLAYLQLRNEVRPRSCWQIFACRVDDAGVTLVDNACVLKAKIWQDICRAVKKQRFCCYFRQ